MSEDTSHTASNAQQETLHRQLERHLAEAGLAPSDLMPRFDGMISATADPDRALVNLLRFLENGFSLPLLREFATGQPMFALAVELFSQSQYLSDILVRDPELFRWLTSGGVLQREKTREELAEEMRSGVALFSRLEKKTDAIRRIHRRELLRIGAREILREADVECSAAELSRLSDAVLETVAGLALSEFSRWKGKPLDSSLAVIGLGKLGGVELNFSSDIDLMFVYEEEGDYPEPFERIHSYHELYVRMAECMVRILTEATNEGHLFRVDLRLRPDGQAGPLALSRQGYRMYYEHRGELWERQMLLKARVVAGDRETGNRFLSDLEPFIYPRSHRTSPLEEISGIKRRIEQSLRNGVANVKLGSGGIRDVEFVIQALQLMHAGTRRGLRKGNSLEALRALEREGILDAREADTLAEAYRFLRTVEHRLQLLHGRQTHELPASRAELERLARRLGRKSAQELESELRSRRRAVRELYDTLFQPSPVRTEDWTPSEVRDSSRWEHAIDPAAAALRFEELCLELPQVAQKSAGMYLQESLERHGAPDEALANLLALARSVGIQRSLRLAAARRETLDLLVLIASRSRRSTVALSQEPLLFETLVGSPADIFSDGWSWTFLRTVDPRRFLHYNEFKLVMRLLIGDLPLREFLGRVSGLADVLVGDALAAAVEDVYGTSAEPQFCLIALGKLGGHEMTVGSDVDCIVVAEDGAAADLHRVERIVQAFLARMDSAGTYRVDLRLRPEGRSAPLCSSLKYYEEYLDRRASLWERQALLKGRFLWGNRELGRHALNLFSPFVFERPLPPGWREEVRAMRNRIVSERGGGRGGEKDLKAGIGGLMDLEFGLQALQLRHGRTDKNLRSTNSFEVLDALEQRTDFVRLRPAAARERLSFLRLLETLVRLNAETPSSLLPVEPAVLKALAGGAGLVSVDELNSRISRVLADNNAFFASVMEEELQ